MAEGPSKPSFANVVRGEPRVDDQGIDVEGPRAGLHRGKPALFFTRPMVSSYAQPYKWALVGKFSQGRPKMEDIHQFLVRMDLKADFKLGLLDSRHVFINLNVEADFHRLFSRMIWYVGRFSMRVFKWTPQFHVSRESSIVPVWVELPRLPVVYFNKQALFALAKLFGQPLRLDAATISLKRPSVARMQVEVDLLKPLPDMVWIGYEEGDGFWQPLNFESLPLYCAHCWHVGHSEISCHVKHPELKVLPIKQHQEIPKVPVKQFRPKESVGGQDLERKAPDGIPKIIPPVVSEGVSGTIGETSLEAIVPVAPLASPIEPVITLEIASKGKGVMECDGKEIMDSQDQSDMSVRVFLEEKEEQLPNKGIQSGETSKHHRLVIEDEPLSPHQQTHGKKVTDDISPQDSVYSAGVIIVSANSQFQDDQGVPNGENKEELFQKIQKLLSSQEIENVVEEAIMEAASESIEQIADRVVHEKEECILEANTVQIEVIEITSTLPNDEEAIQAAPAEGIGKIADKIQPDCTYKSHLEAIEQNAYEVVNPSESGDAKNTQLEQADNDEGMNQVHSLARKIMAETGITLLEAAMKLKNMGNEEFEILWKEHTQVKTQSIEKALALKEAAHSNNQSDFSTEPSGDIQVNTETSDQIRPKRNRRKKIIFDI